MRKGKNIHKDKFIQPNREQHQVIIPLYIPHEEDYYRDAFAVFELCLHSLHKASVYEFTVSVVANGCCAAVEQRLQQLYTEGLIDELVLVKASIGKVNSILKVLRTVETPYVTITDADVLFCEGWDKAVFEVFSNFPKAGAVCPTPVFRKHTNLTYNIWMGYLFSKRLRFTKVVNTEAMTRFANSIGWPWLEEKYKDVYLTLEAKNGFKAMVGCSHFVATYKTAVFTYLPKQNSDYQLGGNSEGDYLDEPVVKAGGYRLSTLDNHTYHMGNVLEDWHQQRFDVLPSVERKILKISNATLYQNRQKHFLMKKCYSFLFKNFKTSILRFKGLSTAQLKNF